jgi:ubiquitin C-terminal hydrolase
MFNFKEYNNKGLSGLVNLGNTCYINSAIQCLSNTYELTEYFLNNSYKDDYDNDKEFHIIVREWKRLIDGIWDTNCTISPTSFIKTVKVISYKKGLINFVGMGQNDVQEFLVFLIDSIHEILAKEVIIKISGKVVNDIDRMALEAMKMWKIFFKDSYSIMVDLFYGQLVSTIELDDSVSSRNYDPCCYFSLPIPNKNNINIYDCFDLFTSTEVLDGDNMVKCEKTGKLKIGKKTIKIWNFPKILIIHLKRFDNNGNKLTNFINFPLQNLNLNKYCVGYDKFNSNFDLFGICNHSGSLNGGHYFAYCKNPNGKWYNYNDSSVREINESGINTDSAYCLFYRKK